MLIQMTNSATSASVRVPGNGSPVVAAQPEVPKAQPVAKPTPTQIESEVSRINSALQQANRNVELSISVDDATRKQVVMLKDKNTGDTLLQYPSEAVLAIARGIDEFQQGQLLNQKA